MDDLKCKKGSKNKELLFKERKKVRKKTRKKFKENGKVETAAGSLDRLLSQISKPGVRKGLGRLRVKGRQRLEGMFFKGLRCEYITREALNEHNEARKNEDLNKIIDLGRNFLQGVHRPGRCTKRITGCFDNRKPKKSSDDLREVSTDSIENFERCSLSPIRQRAGVTGIGIKAKRLATFKNFVTSFAVTPDSVQTEPAHLFEVRRLNLEKELEKFASNYEEAVDMQVLSRLPQGGILEDAFTALRKTRQRERHDSENEKFLEEETQFLDELKFIREDSEPEMPGAEDFIENFAFPKKFPAPESHYYDTFNEKPLENLLIMTDVKAEDNNHPSFTPPFYNDAEKEPGNDFFFENGFKTSLKDLTIVTPDIRFYRRNMF